MKMKTSSYPVMTQLLPLALASVVTFAGLDGIQAQEEPVLPSVKPAQYKAMQQVVSRTLLLIDKDLHQLKNELPQLADMKEVKVRKSHTDWISWNYHYRRAATWIAPKTLGGYAKGGSFEFGKNGCYLLLEFRLYDEKSDPRHGTGAISANPGPHFQVKNNGVPFGIRITVDAEKNASGMAFKKRVNALLSKHLQGLHKELGSRLVSWGKLVDQSSFDRQYVQGAALTRDQEKIVMIYFPFVEKQVIYAP